MRLGEAPADVFDFSASEQISEVRRKSALPLAISVVIHTTAVMLLLALTFSDGNIERQPTARAMVLLSPQPVIQVDPQAGQRMERTPPRLFRAPVIRPIAAPDREVAPVAALQIPLIEVLRRLVPSLEVARLPAVPPPPLRTDNFALLTRAPVPVSSVIAVTRSSGFEEIEVRTPPRPRAALLVGEGFDDATVVPAAQPHRAGIAPAPPVTRAVEIVSKPRPAYTEEARRERIEGEVLLQILFAASGEVRVLGIVSSLGHGLDESAIAAAKAIRFRPAERAGIAADSTAIVHIVFQLAY
jgi:TonB family protein